MTNVLNGSHDTLTLGEWKRLQALPPPMPKPCPAPHSGGGSEPDYTSDRQCEWCSAPIAFNADPRRRYCTASCRAKAAKKRKPVADAATPAAPAVADSARRPASTSPEGAPAEDLEAVRSLANALLADSHTTEVEVRLGKYSIMVRR